MSAAQTQAYEQGRGARRGNPFPKGGDKHDTWNRGYRDQKALDYKTAYGIQPENQR